MCGCMWMQYVVRPRLKAAKVLNVLEVKGELTFM